MSPPTGDFRPSPDAQELADALRAGVAARLSEGVAAPEGDAARLRDLGSLDDLQPGAQPGAHAPFVRVVRRVLRAFLRPWLAAQTIFNLEIARRFEGVVVPVRDLERRLPRLEQSIDDLDVRLRRVEVAGIPTVGSGATNGEAPGPGALALQRMFVHSRLPRPPARVLNIGDPGHAVAIELASFGFDVWTLDSAPAVPSPRQVRRARAAGDALPFAGASFDAVVRLIAVGDAPAPQDLPVPVLREIGRVLKPGGRLLAALSLPAHDPSGAGADTSSTIGPLEVAESMAAIRDAGAWSVTGDASDAAAGSGRLADRLRLIDARRPDAPAR